MNWYLDSGKESDVVISTRIRLARNIQAIPFKLKLNKEQTNELLEKVKYITPSIGYGLKYLELKDMDIITKLSLVEKNIISPESISENAYEDIAILINDEENICVMINEEDHIRIQVFGSGIELKNTINLAKELDKKIDEQLHFSSNQQYGYLTSCPTNLGTGLRASVMVHLPALKLTGNISKILRVVNNFGMAIRGVYGEDSQSKGDIYQISNNQTLGISEDEIINNIENITKTIIEQERLARKYLTKDKFELEDKVYRSFGILTNAIKLSSEECICLLSDVKLGTDLGIISELNDKKVKELELYTKPANLQKYTGELLNAYDRKIRRAQIIKQIMKQK